MSEPVQHFNVLARLLHWSMALLILLMLFIGVGMVSTVSPTYRELLGWHRTIGIIVLVLVAIRLINRLLRGAPPLPADLPGWQRVIAEGSHILLYVLMFAVPLTGWAKLSAAAYPVIVFGAIELPPIAPHSDQLYTALLWAHAWLAYALFAVWLAHFGAALFHRLIRRDHVLQSMT
jgi:cytochrome b561